MIIVELCLHNETPNLLLINHETKSHLRPLFI